MVLIGMEIVRPLQAYRSKQIFDIWTDVWSGQRSRLKYVISTQAVPGQHRSESGVYLAKKIQNDAGRQSKIGIESNKIEFVLVYRGM